MRPVGRTRLLLAKLVAVMAFTLTAVVLVAASAHVLGTQLFDASAPLPSTSGTNLTTTQSTWRTALAVLYVGWSMLGVAAVALFLSTVTDSPLAAALGAVALLVASTVLVGLEAAQSVRPYLPTRYWLAFVDLFRDPVLWRDLVRGTLLQARLRRRLPHRRLGELHDEGRHELSRAQSAGPYAARPGPTSSASSTTAATSGERGRSPWVRAVPGQTSWTTTVVAPSSRALSGGVTTSSWSVHTEVHCGPSGVSSPRSASAAGRCPAPAAGTPAGSPGRPRRAPRPASCDPWCGEPRVTTRRATASPPSSATHQRAVTPPAREADDVDARSARGERRRRRVPHHAGGGAQVARAVARQRHHHRGAPRPA